mgnify:CR=1 FL=1
MPLIPKLSIGKATKVLGSEPMVAVGTAVLFGAVAAAHLTGLIQRIPFAKEHVTIALIIFSFIIITVATRFKSGVLRAVMIGLAGGSFFIGILQIDFVQNNLAKIAARS